MRNRFTMMFTGFLASTLLAAAASGAANPFAGSGHKPSSNAPIEINADTLDVFQEENKAIFSGHVVAIQGNIRLKSDKMTVYYRSSEEKSKTEADKETIRKIDAVGSVFLSTPEETASGARGVYDVEKHAIHLNDNVVLTRGKNVLKGDKLTYNLDTGKSVITGGAQATTPKNGKGKDRVRALFIPDEKKQESKPQ